MDTALIIVLQNSYLLKRNLFHYLINEGYKQKIRKSSRSGERLRVAAYCSPHSQSKSESVIALKTCSQ